MKGDSNFINQGMDRKELLRKEYNRVIETRLPNIYTMMSQFNDGNPTSLRAQALQKSDEQSKSREHYINTVEYDDTSLLKMVLLNSNKGNA